MRFMTMVKSAETNGPPPLALIDAMADFMTEAVHAGQLVDSGGLAPTAAGGRVRITNGKITVLDGPFAEAKEVVGGYAVLELKSKAEAMQVARRFMELHRQHWPGWEGESEIRQIFGPSDFPK